ncbi:polysaccharide pyruvyl transferase family protein [Desulfolucanica intricata]|uniref:polysaccharide pyruvyl transferase family protein n=1 Tax=Desulfolucanica intricata TaxID=1285191 RepID=UPI000836C227|nr:polysaccharide pyruvyl transferase family protein [Desulfolucanica intricata]
MRTFIIIGGHFRNKGAQAMLYAVIQEIKKRFANPQIWAFVGSPIKEKNLKFNHLTWDNRLIKRLLLGKLKFLTKPSQNSINENQIEKILKKADIILDISGFALSSQFGARSSINYLCRIALAKKYNCEMVILPQSFGPFNYESFFDKVKIYTLMKWYLKYPKKIYAREEQGYQDLAKFTSKNLEKSLDIVLLTEKPKPEIFMDCTYKKNVIKVIKKSVAIIPNSKLIEWNLNNDIFNLYTLIINELLINGYNIYILRHSYEDLEFCRDIYKYANRPSQVTVLEGDYDCITLCDIISQMEFVVASRYHSLVHAYKSNVPAIVIGWAEKYKELMNYFNQNEYFFDIRTNINSNEIINSIKKMINFSAEESKTIFSSKRDILDKNNSLSITFDNMRSQYISTDVNHT